MELMTKLKDMIPWKRKRSTTQEVLSLRDDINQLFDRFLCRPWKPDGLGLPGRLWVSRWTRRKSMCLHADIPGLDPNTSTSRSEPGLLHVSYEDERECVMERGKAAAVVIPRFIEAWPCRTASMSQRQRPPVSTECWLSGYPGCRSQRRSRRMCVSVE